MTHLEHVNISVSEPQKTSDILSRIFSWHVRWMGAAMDDGFTVHVGEKEVGGTYLALYSPKKPIGTKHHTHRSVPNLNHVAVIVDNLQEIEQRVLAEGFTPFNFGNYEPGKRFYFNATEELEIEVVSYPS